MTDKVVTKKYLDKVVGIILKELQNMRKENREFYQMREQLYTNDIIQERKLDDHEDRLHALEIAQ